mgnify:CR=1 FL=1
MNGKTMTMTEKKLWRIMAAAVILSRLLQYAGQGWAVWYTDSYAYSVFYLKDLFQGQAAQGVPPLYAVFLHAMQAVFGQGYLNAVCAVQILLSMLSLVLLARILCQIGVGSPWAQLCVFLYATTSAVAGWDTVIMTESLSLSGTVAFFYCITQYLHTTKLRYGLLAVLLTELLIFLRPQFLTYWAILLVFLLLRLAFPDRKTERVNLLKMLAALAAGLVLVLGYCAVCQKQFGLFSMTVAGARQDMVVAVRYGYYPDFEDTEMAEAMCRTAETGDEDAVVQTALDFGWARAQKAARTYFRKHPVQYLYDTAMQMGKDSVTDFHGYAWESKQAPMPLAKLYSFWNYGVFGALRIGHVMVASAAAGVIMAVQWVRRRKIPWLWAAFFSTTCSMVVTTYFATCDEYMRTMLGVLPGLYMMGAMLLQTVADACRKRCATRKEKPQ